MSTTTRTLQMRLVKALEILMDKVYVPVSKTDIIIFVIGSAGAGKSTFLNTAISEDVMAVNHSIVSETEDVESIKCTSPWNPSGRSVIFVEIPAFNHSDTTMQKKIPDLISRWLNRTYCPEGPVDSGIIYLHSMASQRITDDFKKQLDFFVTLCRAGGHRPTSALLVSNMWPSKESEAYVIERTRELEEHFKKTAPSSIRPIPYSVRFDGSRITACKAINSLILEIEQDVKLQGKSTLTESISKADTIIFVIGSTGAGKSTFINTAISEDVMVVNNSLESSIAEVKSTQSTNSPWNSSGRSVIFVEIPAFNHSDLAMQMKIPYLISRWLTKTSRRGKPVNSGIIYLHSMASQRMNEKFNKYLDPFVNLCHACGHKPTSVLLVSTLWYDDDDESGTDSEMYEKTLELEEHFQKAAGSAIHSIPYSVRFDGSHDQISACNAVDLLMLDMMQQNA